MKWQNVRRSLPAAALALRNRAVTLLEKPEAAASVPSSRGRWLLTILPAALIVAAALAAYHNSFGGPFLYDDLPSIVDNGTIRQLWPVRLVLSPPTSGETVSGRPLLNLSFALNYALGGRDVQGYHVANLAIHIAAALLLFGIVRRTFLTPALRDRFGQAATLLALASALLWAVHPLQTESVTYIVQRAESLMGLFYLLTLYCFIRGAGAETVPFFVSQNPTFPSAVVGEKGDCPTRHWSGLWYAAAIVACLLGMATKEVMVTAPLVVLLYDRTFLAGSFTEALRRHWALYLGLAATWGLLAYLVYSTGLIPRQPEFGAPDPWSYARTQPGVILHYFRLAFWPRPLCFEYGWAVARTLGEILPGAMAIATLLAATIWGLLGRRVWGFPGAWCLLILVPTSSILPLAQLAGEHRMYLSLAAVTVVALAGGYAFCDQWLPRPAAPGRGAVPARWTAPLLACAAVILALGYMTVQRNSVYRSSLATWQDTVDTRPASPVAHNNLGNVLVELDRTTEAVQHYREALRLKPDYAGAHYNLANLLETWGRSSEAIAQYQMALRLKPEYVCAHNNLGIALHAAGRSEEAIAHYREALRLNPDYPELHNNLATALTALGRTGEAIAQCQEALRLKPDDAVAYNNLGFALTRAGKFKEAIGAYEQALRLKPDFPEVHYNLGIALAKLARTEEAIAHYQQALRLKPNDAEARNNLAVALAQVGRTEEAIESLQEGLRMKCDSATARYNLARALTSVGRINDAIEHYQQALRLKPDFAMAHHNLARVLASVGKTAEAMDQYQQLLQLTPDSIEVLNDLAWLLATQEPPEAGGAARAVRLAQRARELAGEENAQCLDTLAAAYAAAARFDDAIIIAQQAMQLAQSTGQTELTKNIQSRLELYRAGRPYRETKGER